MINVADKYGLDMTGATDNASKLAQCAADIAALRAAEKPLPRLVFLEGIVSFSAWPDLAYPNLQIVAEGECRLVRTGAGDAVVFDGSLRTPNAQEPGIDNLTFRGFEIFAPPAGVALTLKGIHRSDIAVRVMGLLRAPAIAMNFCVVTKIRPVIEGYYKTGIGLVVDAWPGKPNLQTTACTIDTPCIEGCDVGLQMQNVASCFIHGGTIENCTTGIELGYAGHNSFVAIDMEGNTIDVNASTNAKGNVFSGCGNDGNLKTNIPWNPWLSSNRVLK